MKKLFIIGLCIFIGFFIAATTIWFVFDKDKYSSKSYHNEFSKDAFNRITINIDSCELHLKKGNKFRMKYSGDNHLQVNTSNNHLNIKEQRSKNRGYALNLNPFHNQKKYLVLEIPDKQLDKVSIVSGSGQTNFEGLNTKKMEMQKFNGNMMLKDSKINDLDFKSQSGSVNIKDSKLTNSNIKLDEGRILTKHLQLHNSVFINDKGSIMFKDMPGENDVKASTKSGDIKYAYSDKPQNTLLKLKPGNGDSHINNKAFTKGKVGTSDNILEFYTINGDIIID